MAATMLRLYPFVFLALAMSVNAADDGLADFSNDLATDLGPLLALFGESMTRQYLSESTTFLDYFIFAMCPIGILTAIVSVIRVCGHSSLKAFIGRAQEGNGVVEAELCTSTSRDVCELFNKGGITRVLGRPAILELIYNPPVASTGLTGSSKGFDVAPRLSLFRHYLIHSPEDSSHWEAPKTWPAENTRAPETRRTSTSGPRYTPRETSQTSRQSQDTTSHPLDNPELNPPNLSLNVGIVRQGKCKFWAVAILGFVLQGGVITLAGIGAWGHVWNVNEADESPSNKHAPVMFIAGTTIMCAGLWGCAAIIGQITDEHQYSWKESTGDSSRLIWLQLNQVIGDQTFDSFAHLKEGKAFQTWTCSKMSASKKLHKTFELLTFELLTFAAVFAVLAGYIMQFIGLRGMKAWVSLAQLGATVIMSLFRGLLRMRRFGEDNNKLKDELAIVGGHELDWLASGILQLIEEDENRGHDRSQPSENVIQSSHGSQNIESNMSHKPSADGFIKFEIRKRLAHLTGHFPSDNPLSEGEFLSWDDTHVKVRKQAKLIANSFSIAIDQLIHIEKRGTPITVKMPPFILPDVCCLEYQNCPVYVELQASTSGWKLDASQIEALLGLVMWSKFAHEHSRDVPNGVRSLRIVSADLDNEMQNTTANMQGQMDLWLGFGTIKLSEAVLDIDRCCNGPNSFNGLWHKLRPLPEHSDTLKRSYGWCSLSGLLTPQKTGPSQSPSVLHEICEGRALKLRVQYIEREGSILDICCREIFSALIVGLKDQMIIEPPTTETKTSKVLLSSPTMTTLSDAFQRAGLGDHSEAVLSILPALGHRMLLNDPFSFLEAVLQRSGTHRKNSQWTTAEKLLKWVCTTLLKSQSSPGITSDGNEFNAFPYSLMFLGDLYSCSISKSSDSDRVQFGTAGLQWMADSFAGEASLIADSDAQYVLQSYNYIHESIYMNDIESGSLVASDEAILLALSQGHDDPAKIRKDLLDRKFDPKSQAAHLPALKESATARFSEHFERQENSLVPLAAELGWNGVLKTLLELSASPDSSSDDGQAPISYALRRQDVEAVTLLVLHGASLAIHQPQEAVFHPSATPLISAVKLRNREILQILLENRHVDVNRTDALGGYTPLLEAIFYKSESMVAMLLQKGAKVRHLDAGNALSPAISVGYLPVIQLLVASDSGCIVDLSGQFDEGLLSKVINDGHYDIAEFLTHYHASIEVHGADGWTPLYRAAQMGNITAVRFLLEHKARVDYTARNCSTPLYAAVDEGYVDVARVLLEHGASVHGKGYFGISVLERAKELGNEEMISILTLRESQST